MRALVPSLALKRKKKKRDDEDKMWGKRKGKRKRNSGRTGREKKVKEDSTTSFVDHGLHRQE